MVERNLELYIGLLAVALAAVVALTFSATETRANYDKVYHQRLYLHGNYSEYISYTNRNIEEIDTELNNEEKEMLKFKLAKSGISLSSYEFTKNELKDLIATTNDKDIAFISLIYVAISYIALGEYDEARKISNILNKNRRPDDYTGPLVSSIDGFLNYEINGNRSSAGYVDIDYCKLWCEKKVDINTIECHYINSILSWKAGLLSKEEESLVNVVNLSSFEGLDSNIYMQNAYIRLISNDYPLNLEFSTFEIRDDISFWPKKVVVDCLMYRLNGGDPPPIISAQRFREEGSPYNVRFYLNFLLRSQCLN